MSIRGSNTATHCHCPNNGPPTPGFSLTCYALGAECAFIPSLFQLWTPELEPVCAVSASVMAFPIIPRNVSPQYCSLSGDHVLLKDWGTTSASVTPLSIARLALFPCCTGVLYKTSHFGRSASCCHYLAKACSSFPPWWFMLEGKTVCRIYCSFS